MELIISGGQTGADQGGLLAARDLGIPTGGWAPQDYLTEDGPQPLLLTGLGLKEYHVPGYPARTEANICSSDATVIFGNLSGLGSKLTFRLCNQYHVPVFLVSGPGAMLESDIDGMCKWLAAYRPQVLNVAGSRESKNHGIQEAVRKFMGEVLRRYINHE